MIHVLQDIKPPSTKLKSPMPEAENTSWTQSSAAATKPVVEIREDKVADSDLQEDKKVGCFMLQCVGNCVVTRILLSEWLFIICQYM